MGAHRKLRFLAPAGSLLAAAAWCQTPAAKPVFDLGDVHVSPRSVWVNKVGNNLQGGFLRGDRYELKHATMLDLIRTAYGVDADKVFGGPSWLEYDKYELSAKTKPGTKTATLRLMLQSLLEERFKLVLKADSKPVPAYLLKAVKERPNLKPAEGSNASGCTAGLSASADGGPPLRTIRCRNVTMESFAAGLRLATPAAFSNLPVVDSTGIDGTYDIDLGYQPISAAGAPAGPEALLKEVEKLGLKFEKGTAPQPVLSVESVNEMPAPNAPGIETTLPPLPGPQFEVASIRPCDSNGPNISPRFETGGRVTMRCMYPSILINNVFNLAPFEEPVGKPKWMGNNSQPAYTLEAKAPEDAIPNGVPVAQQQEIIRAMILGLLRERWGLVTHFEQQPKDALTLLAVKPKLTKADPANRTGCTRQTGPAADDSPRGRVQGQPGGLEIRVVCRNMTMAQFAEQIPGFDLSVFYPVEDGTGIEGAWDFTVSYSPTANLPRLFPQAANGGNPGGVSDPDGALSFREAVEKQLGLKFETHKRPEPVLVIDHINDKPTEN
jgi:uncharacterized protein (TIGR03435 family)